MMHAEAGRIWRRVATTWPWRGPRPFPGRRPVERYAGESVLRDLVVSEGDAASAVRIVARFAAVRAVLRAFEGGSDEAVRAERSAALDQVGGLPADPEQRALETAIVQLECRPSRRLATSLLTAASSAMAARHREGARMLYVLAWRAAREARAGREAAEAARAMEQEARAAGLHRAAQLWRRRAGTHEIVRTD